jgi:CheY-like chemotaxis protein
MSRILLVDDDETLRDVMREGLELAGHSVLPAANGHEALRLAKSKEFDILLTDIIMPDKEGFETIAEIHDLFPNKAIIAMSGGGQVGAEDYLEIAQKLGAQVTLEKPFAIRKLLEIVRKLAPPA